MNDCLFCKIIAGEIPSTKVYENDKVYAFRDINPQAPVHVLIVPKTHVANVIEGVEAGLMDDLLKAAVEIAKQEGVDKSGFRLLTNCGKDGAQSVNHLHLHLLGGAQLAEKMG